VHTNTVQTDNIIFRIPVPLKRDFQNICSQMQTSMTSEINQFIREFISSKSKELVEMESRVTRMNEPLGFFSSDDFEYPTRDTDTHWHD
jgi:hypothetical protein